MYIFSDTLKSSHVVWSPDDSPDSAPPNLGHSHPDLRHNPMFITPVTKTKDNHGYVHWSPYEAANVTAQLSQAPNSRVSTCSMVNTKL